MSKLLAIFLSVLMLSMIVGATSYEDKPIKYLQTIYSKPYQEIYISHDDVNNVTLYFYQTGSGAGMAAIPDSQLNVETTHGFKNLNLTEKQWTLRYMTSVMNDHEFNFERDPAPSNESMEFVVEILR